MTIKRILVPLSGSANTAGEIETALQTAGTFKAHLEALFIREPPPTPSTSADLPAAYAGRMAARAPQTWQADEMEKRARQARESFRRSCIASEVRFTDGEDAPDTPPSASWRDTDGPYSRIATTHAAGFDLIVATSAAVARPLKEIAEDSILRTGRPVMLAPTRLDNSITGTVVIAWDESPECWHAVSAALPFLKQAAAVQIVSVDKDESGRASSQQELVTYLRYHDVDATAKVVEPLSRSTGETLLAVAGEERAGLLVMGAYSHSRLREYLLGGATRYVLDNAAATPVLMAH